MNKLKSYTKILLVILLMIISVLIGFAISWILIEKKYESKDNVAEEVRNECVYDYLDEETIYGEIPVDQSYYKLNVLLNDSTHTLSYEEDENEVFTLKFDETVIHKGSVNTASIYNIYYQVLTAKDNKEYIIVSYEKFGKFVYILDNNGSIVKHVSEYSTERDCFLRFEFFEKSFYIKDNSFYYYRYKKDSDSLESEVILELIKIDINNGKVTETALGIEKTTYLGQCT